MRSIGRQSAAKQWARFAMKCALFLTDAKLWSALNDQLRDRAEDMGDVVRRRYEDTSDRLHDASDAFRGRTNWVSPTLSFIGGVGVGIGVGMLLAPVSGEEARAAIRDTAYDMKNKVNDMTGSGSRLRPTGTDGD